MIFCLTFCPRANTVSFKGSIRFRLRNLNKINCRNCCMLSTPRHSLRAVSVSEVSDALLLFLLTSYIRHCMFCIIAPGVISSYGNKLKVWHSILMLSACFCHGYEKRNKVYSFYTVTIQKLSSPMLISFSCMVNYITREFHFAVFSEIILVQVLLSEITR